MLCVWILYIWGLQKIFSDHTAPMIMCYILRTCKCNVRLWFYMFCNWSDHVTYIFPSAFIVVICLWLIKIYCFRFIFHFSWLVNSRKCLKTVSSVRILPTATILCLPIVVAVTTVAPPSDSCEEAFTKSLFECFTNSSVPFNTYLWAVSNGSGGIPPDNRTVFREHMCRCEAYIDKYCQSSYPEYPELFSPSSR